jgi:hypothetical protein
VQGEVARAVTMTPRIHISHPVFSFLRFLSQSPPNMLLRGS